MNPGLYNMDCMEAMKQFPDGFFDLAIVDPPYGDGNSKIGGVRFGGLFDRYKTVEPVRTALRPIQEPEHAGRAEPGRRSTAKKSLRGTLRLEKSTLKSFSASHATRSSGAAITLNCPRPDAFWYGAN